MPDQLEWTQSGALSRVVYEPANRKYVISTSCNRFGIWETCVFAANRFFIPKKSGNPILVLNASNREQAEAQHCKALSDFQEQDLSQLARIYRFEGGAHVSLDSHRLTGTAGEFPFAAHAPQGFLRRLLRFLTGR